MYSSRPYRAAGNGRIVNVVLLLIGILLMQGQPAGSPQAPSTPEYRLKATFLYQFAQFVDWPDQAFSGPQSPLIIGILGDDPFGRELDQTVQGESVSSHPMGVRRFRRLDEVRDCHILFVSRSEGARLDETLAALKGRNILTVADLNGFAQRGGMIQFSSEASRIRLTINLDAARGGNLAVSTKLLRLATVISSDGL
jgi:hypothetical protein